MSKISPFEWKKFCETSSLPSVYGFGGNPFLAGLWVLFVSKTECSSPHLSYTEIEEILQDHLDIAIDANALKKAFARASNRVIRNKADGSLKISSAGEKHLFSFSKDEPLQVIYVEPKTPRTAKKNLESLIASIKPCELMITDPYYGMGALDNIEMFLKHHKSVRFLTAKLGGPDKAPVAQRIKDLMVEHKGKFEIRLGSAADLHDRYIIASDSFLLVGQGIKDLGNKESFILSIDDSVGKQIRTVLRENFIQRWAAATAP